jgi:hypothetical protein
MFKVNANSGFGSIPTIVAAAAVCVDINPGIATVSHFDS